MAEVGFARFSAREVAKRIGYTVGTIYHVFGTLDRLLIEVNTRTFVIWADAIAAALDRGPDDRIATLVESYFNFAGSHRHLWNAIYDHHLPIGHIIDEDQAQTRGRLTGIIADEVAKVLPPSRRAESVALTRSLIATVHGHCALDMGGSFGLMGGENARQDALTRVREIILFDARRSPAETAA